MLLVLLNVTLTGRELLEVPGLARALLLLLLRLLFELFELFEVFWRDWVDLEEESFSDEVLE